MIIKGIIEEDFINYKRPSMFIAFPCCTFKCEEDCGIRCCQNSELAISKEIDVQPKEIIKRYINNPITSAIVFGGLEPLDSFNDMICLIELFRRYTNDVIVIYTGYYEDEVDNKIQSLRNYKNIVVKFGRFIPNDISVYDEVLGIKLASHNQYAKQIS